MSKYRYIPIAGGGGEIPVLETLNATQNGQYFPGEGVTGWNEVNIDVPAPYWSGTQAQYDALPSYSNDMLYLIIN